MPGPLTGIDHVVIAVRDLAQASLGWSRLGFALTPRGRHMQRGTGNYCIMFAEDYLELIGIANPAQGTNGLDVFLARGEGIQRLAFATGAGDDTAAALAARGLHPAVARELARQIELPEGTMLLRFRLLSLRAEETPALDTFFCQHLTPEKLRRPAWLAHPNGAVGVHGVTVLVETTAPLLAAYEKLVGPAAVTQTDDVLTVHVGRHRLVFATPDDFSALYPEATPGRAGALPSIALVTLVSRDLELTADHLTQWQVPHEVLGDGAVLVPAAEANGATLLFTPA